jgi:hypothetical protein
VVSTVLNVASSISGKIEERQEADETLETVHSMLSGIAPVIAQVGEAAECGGTPTALVGALQAMAATMKEVQKQVDSYTNTWTGLKYAVAKEAEEDLRACLEELDRQLNLVSTAISGQTYVRERASEASERAKRASRPVLPASGVGVGGGGEGGARTRQNAQRWGSRISPGGGGGRGGGCPTCGDTGNPLARKNAQRRCRCVNPVQFLHPLLTLRWRSRRYVEVLKSHGMLEELKLGVFGTETHLAKIRGEMATAEQMDAMGKRMMDKLEEFSSAQEELGRGQAAMDGKLDAAGKERAEMRGEINANIEGVSKKQDDLLRKQAAMNGKHDAAGKEQAEMRGEINAKLDGLAASKEMQGKRQRAKIEREAALEDAEIAEADIVLDPNALLGAGGFGEVWKGMIYKRTPVALKVVLTKGLTVLQRNKLVRDFVNEVAIMKNLTHPNIVGIWGCCTSATDKLYVRERPPRPPPPPPPVNPSFSPTPPRSLLCARFARVGTSSSSSPRGGASARSWTSSGTSSR